MKNILILGAGGFIGREIYKQLIQDSRYQIMVLLHENFDYKDYEDANVIVGNLKSFNERWLKKYPPDIVFHLARFAGRWNITRGKASSLAYKANTRFIQLLKNNNLAPIIITVSGSLMYGNQSPGKQANENTKLNPVSFGKYYIKGEDPWIQEQLRGELDIRFARPGWIVGHNSWFKTFFLDFFYKNKCIPVYGNGSQLMSLVSLSDCARLIIDMLELPPKNNLNVFSLPPVSQLEFSRKLSRLFETDIEEVNHKKLSKKFGNTAAEALISNIPLTSVHENFYENFVPGHSCLNDILNYGIKKP